MAFNDGSQLPRLRIEYGHNSISSVFEDLAAAKRDEAEDELWASREDAAYFQETLQDRYQENCESSRKASAGEMSRSVRLKVEMHSLQEACRNLIQIAYQYVVVWDILLTELKRLAEIEVSLWGGDFRPQALSLYLKNIPKHHLSPGSWKRFFPGSCFERIFKQANKQARQRVSLLPTISTASEARTPFFSSLFSIPLTRL